MTQAEYEQKKRECWENFKFARRPLNTDKKVFDYIFDRAYALGKQEKDAEDAVISGWVGRDQDGNLPLFVGSKPYKPEGMDYWSVPHGRSLEYLNLNPALFPDLKWESDPIEVELIIKRKKK